MTHALANILASLYSKRFGIKARETDDDSSNDRSQDAIGTGMGEGAGINDASDQINDADQLLGTEKAGEGQDVALDEVPNKDNEGLEMEQYFTADTYSVCEDSSRENNDEDSEDEQLESAMGETGADSEVNNEELWNKEEDE